jgi:endonuclease-8
MPEGPETHRAADRIRRVLAGRTAQEVGFGLAGLAGEAEALVGRTVRDVEARGKATLVRFEGDLNVYSHNQLYGRWYVRRDHGRPRTGRQLRFWVHVEGGSALLYSASDIAVLRDDDLDAHRYLASLGPDPLRPGVGVEQIRARLEDTRFRGRRLHGLLLDQSFVGGVGNYLRSEILFVARVHPDRRPKDLDETTRDDLARLTVEQMRRAKRTAGITVEDDLARSLRAEGLPKRALRHYVFARPGKRCRLCDSEIERLERSGRRLDWCPACQTR